MTIKEHKSAIEDKPQIVQIIYHALTALHFVVIFLPVVIINFFQMASVLILPISKKVFHRINRAFANFYWGFLVFYMRYISKIEIIIAGDEIPEKENVIMESNHQNIADIPVMMELGWQKKRLGDYKFFVKDVIKYVPGPGWGMLFLNCIFVKRNWQADKKNIEDTFESLKSNRLNYWLISFLEGTRITPEKYERNLRFMNRRGLPITKNVMAPRTKGFLATIEALRDNTDAVYNLTIYYPAGIPNMWQLIGGEVDQVVIHVSRTNMNQLPTDITAIEKWIIEKYVEKDLLLTALKARQDRSDASWTKEEVNRITSTQVSPNEKG